MSEECIPTETIFHASIPDHKTLLQQGNPHDLRCYLMDSGASSHFTPYFSDLQDPKQCQIEVMLADSSRVRATQQGSVSINFTSDQGQPSKLNLQRVIYVPGLNTRLFSISAFTRDSDFTVNFGDNFSQLIFGDGQTYKIPTPHKPEATNTTLQLNSAKTTEKGSTYT